jgi:3-hydroxybutyryl-CoA dehydrogenase
MSNDRISRVAVCGAGLMGPGIAAVAALAGCAVTLVGRSAASMARGQQSFRSALAFLKENEVITADDEQAAVARLTATDDMAAAAPADLVIEAIIENLAIKQQYFVELERVFGPQTILASCTSALRISDIAAGLQHPERAITAHFWNPAHLMPLVDVMQGEKTSEDTVQRVRRFLLRCGKRPVVGRRDVPGQIGNRLQHALVREAIYMVQEGIASAEDVETAIKAGFGLRLPVYGPFEHADAHGLALTLAVQTTVSPHLCNATEPLPLLKEMVATGKTGAHAGQGFHDWRSRSIEDVIRRRDLFLVQRLKESRREQQ